MITAGLKLTQSGGIAILDEDRLMFNVEMQKIANGARYSNVDELDDLVGVMDKFGLKVGDVGTWALDGWDGAAGGHVNVLAGGIQTEVWSPPTGRPTWCPTRGCRATAAG